MLAVFEETPGLNSEEHLPSAFLRHRGGDRAATQEPTAKWGMREGGGVSFRNFSPMKKEIFKTILLEWSRLSSNHFLF